MENAPKRRKNSQGSPHSAGMHLTTTEQEVESVLARIEDEQVVTTEKLHTVQTGRIEKSKKARPPSKKAMLEEIAQVKQSLSDLGLKLSQLAECKTPASQSVGEYAVDIEEHAPMDTDMGTCSYFICSEIS